MHLANDGWLGPVGTLERYQRITRKKKKEKEKVIGNQMIRAHAKLRILCSSCGKKMFIY